MERSATGVVRIAAIPILMWLFRQRFEPPRPWPVATPSPPYRRRGTLVPSFATETNLGIELAQERPLHWSLTFL